MRRSRLWVAAGTVVAVLSTVTVTALLFSERGGLQACTPAAIDSISGDLLELNDNGAWSWYTDERAVVDGSSLLVGSVADDRGSGGHARAGNVEIAAYDLETQRLSITVLGTVDADDHNSASLLVRPDGRYLAAYSNHHQDSLTRYQVSVNPRDPTVWEGERTFDNVALTSYSNLIHLPAEDRTYLFTRSQGFDPNVLVSEDAGSTWTHGGWLLKDPLGDPHSRPYVKYVSDGTDTIYFVATDGHPNRVDTSIYAGYLRGGLVHTLEGTEVGRLATTLAEATDVAELTPLMTSSGDAVMPERSHGWPSDLALTQGGQPVAVFTAREDSDLDRSTVEVGDHRFHYAEWSGREWLMHEIAKAGPGLYPGEEDYTGLAALDAVNPVSIYISTPIDPVSGADLRHYEIYRGTTADHGQSWHWAALSAGSSVDNIRPIVPHSSEGSPAVLWLRGTYTTYTEYDLAVVGLLDGSTPLVTPVSPCLAP